MGKGRDRESKAIEAAAERVGGELMAELRQAMVACGLDAIDNLAWLKENMPPYFFISMAQEKTALLNLINGFSQLAGQSKMNLWDDPNKLILARRDLPGSLYDTLKNLQERSVSYAEMTHSNGPMPGCGECLEVQKFEFTRKRTQEVAAAGPPKLPTGLFQPVSRVMRELYPEYDFGRLKKDLWLLWFNNQDYVAVSPPERLARAIWAYFLARRHDGLHLDVEEMPKTQGPVESRLVFAVGNPPAAGFLAQAMEVCARLHIGVRRFYALTISNPYHAYFLGNFYVYAHDQAVIKRGSERFEQLKSELYNTQILAAHSQAYRVFLGQGLMSGEEASMVNAFIGFCHTTLAHGEPERFNREEVENAFIGQPGMSRQLCDLFRLRFSPGGKEREKEFTPALKRAKEAVENFNTGNRRLDKIRREVYRACLLFIQCTLKTNFYVPEKHALAFRLDPAYLDQLDEATMAALPKERPFRVTFFFSRYGLGYHLGFSDIARGGWRTVICKSADEYASNTNTVFKEVYVLAHTQHLKNKDIYEGGSKLTLVMDAVGLAGPEASNQRLYKLQFGITNAFLDLFVTEGGKAKNPHVVDYYGDDEPIEIGPDENMHDSMIELIARQAERRGYILGKGIMSSKEVGINHKDYGVTSRGVVRFATVALEQAGIEIEKDPFSLKMTGGPYGDVAGNALKLLLARCPRMAVKVIIDGSGALYDPQGADHGALGKIVLRGDIEAFNPQALHPGGYLLYRSDTMTDGLVTRYKKVERGEAGLTESWITNDELQKGFDSLLFEVETDLFMPCGGRPETIDAGNVGRLFNKNHQACVKVIVEGANSFITPAARDEIQARGVILMRDASANKCGVISSSYEILGNLMMSEREFIRHKVRYVGDVLHILDKRAEEEARLIFKRFEEVAGRLSYTEISNQISTEINRHYSRLFAFFQERGGFADKPAFRKVIVSHLPAFIAESASYRGRVNNLPLKIKDAILACEIATRIVYLGGWEEDLAERLAGFVKRSLEQG